MKVNRINAVALVHCLMIIIFTIQSCSASDAFQSLEIEINTTGFDSQQQRFPIRGTAGGFVDVEFVVGGIQKFPGLCTGLVFEDSPPKGGIITDIDSSPTIVNVDNKRMERLALDVGFRVSSMKCTIPIAILLVDIALVAPINPNRPPSPLARKQDKTKFAIINLDMKNIFLSQNFEFFSESFAASIPEKVNIGEHFFNIDDLGFSLTNVQDIVDGMPLAIRATTARMFAEMDNDATEALVYDFIQDAVNNTVETFVPILGEILTPNEFFDKDFLSATDPGTSFGRSQIIKQANALTESSPPETLLNLTQILNVAVNAILQTPPDILEGILDFIGIPSGSSLILGNDLLNVTLQVINSLLNEPIDIERDSAVGGYKDLDLLEIFRKLVNDLELLDLEEW